MSDESANQFKLVVRKNADGTETRAVELHIQVPEGICWENLGHRLLAFGTHYIGQALVDAAPPEPEKPCKAVGHQWVENYSRTMRTCSHCQKVEKYAE